MATVIMATQLGHAQAAALVRAALAAADQMVAQAP